MNARVSSSPCVGCHWFEACAYLNAICEAWAEAAKGKPWDASQRVPMRPLCNSVRLEPIADNQLARAFQRTQSNYREMLAARPAVADPMDDADEDAEEAA